MSACPRETEVHELLKQGQWPQAATPELRAHVSGCRFCGDLVLVATVFQHARSQAVGAARLGAPGLLWWRAQLRQRNAAVQRIGRPILGAQIFALTLNVLVAVGFIVWQARHGLAWLTGLEQLPLAAGLHVDSLWPTTLFDFGFGSALTPVVLISALATLAVLGGVVVYLAWEKP